MRTPSTVLNFPNAAEPAGITFGDHDRCLALSGLFRGKLCDQLVKSRPRRRLAAGESIYRIGDVAETLFFVHSGLLKGVVVTEAGQELILQIHKPRDIFGELCFCETGRLDQAVAIEPSEITEIHFDDLVSHLQQNRQALLDLLKAIGERLSEAYEQLRTFAIDRRMERLVRTLLKLGKDFGTRTSAGIEIAHYLKQEEIGQVIGARREVVSGLLNQLRSLGLISYSRNHKIAIDAKGLERYLRKITSKSRSRSATSPSP